MHSTSLQRGEELLIFLWGSREGMCRATPPSPTIPPADAPSRRAVAKASTSETQESTLESRSASWSILQTQVEA